MNFEKIHFAENCDHDDGGPIYASLNSFDDLDPDTERVVRDIELNGVNVDWSLDDATGKEKHNGANTYVISSIDDKSKFSKYSQECLIVVVVGKDKNNKNLSFMTHHFPRRTLDLVEDDDLEQWEKKLKSRGSFERDFRESCAELRELCENKEIDVVVCGGAYYIAEGKEAFNESILDYNAARKQIEEISKDELGVGVKEVVAPKEDCYCTNAYFDNKHRRMYIFQDYYESFKSHFEKS